MQFGTPREVADCFRDNFGRKGTSYATKAKRKVNNRLKVWSLSAKGTFFASLKPAETKQVEAEIPTKRKFLCG